MCPSSHEPGSPKCVARGILFVIVAHIWFSRGPYPRLIDADATCEHSIQKLPSTLQKMPASFFATLLNLRDQVSETSFHCILIRLKGFIPLPLHCTTKRKFSPFGKIGRIQSFGACISSLAQRHTVNLREISAVQQH